MKYKIGDKVRYKKNKTTRRIIDIDKDGNLKIWGIWQYISPRHVRKVNKDDFIND